jgi:hypothetical protein
MSSFNGNPFWQENRRRVCGVWDQWPQHFCPAGDEGESGNQCRTQYAGDPWRVLGAPESCGNIMLILCGRS